MRSQFSNYEKSGVRDSIFADKEMVRNSMGQRPKSSIVYLRRSKSGNPKKYIPEEYYKRCGYKPTDRKNSHAGGKQIKLIKAKNHEFWKQDEPNNQRFNEELNYDVRSTASKKVNSLLKKDQLENLSKRSGEVS